MRIKVARIIPMTEVSSQFYSPERDGVTFSILNTFRQCREKARLVLNGWTSSQSSLGTVFGTLVHGVNQYIYDDVRRRRIRSLPSKEYIHKACRVIETQWKKENPKADADSLQYLEFSMILLEAIMPVYFRYWKRDFDLVWKQVETEFKWPYTVRMPDGRIKKTFLRGKIDGSFGQKKRRATLFETKTKSRLGEHGESNLADILPHELQVNIYLLYLMWLTRKVPAGVLYNIVRRPGLRQKKKESVFSYAQRVAADIEKRPEYYFIRMQMIVSKKDLDKQEGEIQDLISDFILWWNGHAGHYKNSDQCENKFGVCGFLPICARGDYTGFYRREKVFRELTDEL